MIAVDSSAIVAIALDEPERRAFTRAILADGLPLVSVASILEVTLKLCRHEATTEKVDALIAMLGLQPVAVDESQLRTAQSAFLTYGKGRHPAGLNYGDCLSYALAKTRHAPLLFKGNDFTQTDIARALTPDS